MTEMTRITIPDIGDFDEVEVIEVLAGVGDAITVEDPIITLESDKATMEIPSPVSGTVASISVSIGDRVSEGALVAEIVEAETAPPPAPRRAGALVSPTPPQGGSDWIAGTSGPSDHSPLEGESKKARRQAMADSVGGAATQEPAPGLTGRRQPTDEPVAGNHSPPRSSRGQALEGESQPAKRVWWGAQAPNPLPHASPGIRRFARELGADLNLIAGSGPKGRILKEDVKNWVKRQLEKPPEGLGIPAVPEIDFSEFGDVETVKLTRIRKLSGPHLQRAWLNVPHVTHHDEADITELEEFRQSLKAEASKKGLRITLLSFAIKALVGALKEYPNFNASLAPGGEQLILKRYFNIGIAIDTPDGLVAPVIRDADRKSIFTLAQELGDLSERARNNKLRPDDLKGGCITISSLGGIGGIAFTPIVNAPEVAILGIARARMTPVWNDQDFVPRLILPLSLSYDHRVVDGAEAARFVSRLTRSFADVRRLSL